MSEAKEDIVLVSMSILEANSNTLNIRKITPLARMTESDVSISISSLMANEFVEDSEDVLGPKTELFISEKGKEKIQELNQGLLYGSNASLKKQLEKSKEDARLQKEARKLEVKNWYNTHEWQVTGDYGSGAGQITRDKWFPMGGVCKKCGMNTFSFKVSPKECPK